MAVCPAWSEHRRVVRDVVGDGDLSSPALVEGMVWSEGDLVMQAKKETGRVWKRNSALMPTWSCGLCS